MSDDVQKRLFKLEEAVRTATIRMDLLHKDMEETRHALDLLLARIENAVERKDVR